jgi:hypothetical protein
MTVTRLAVAFLLAGLVLVALGVAATDCKAGVALAAAPAYGQEYVVATTRAYHFDRGRDYNESNFGLGYERRVSENWSLATGYYKNSFSRDTVYLFGAYTPYQLSGWRFGPLVGLVTGYERHPSPWLTGVATKDWGRFGVNVVWAPAAVALQVKWRFD